MPVDRLPPWENRLKGLVRRIAEHPHLREKEASIADRRCKKLSPTLGLYDMMVEDEVGREINNVENAALVRMEGTC